MRTLQTAYRFLEMATRERKKYAKWPFKDGAFQYSGILSANNCKKALKYNTKHRWHLFSKLKLNFLKKEMCGYPELYFWI